jgi:hypothetical protein
MENNNFLANRIYTSILRFDENIDTEKAWYVANRFKEISMKKEAAPVYLERELEIDKTKSNQLSEILIKMIKGRKSFQKFYNSKEAREERNSSLK